MTIPPAPQPEVSYEELTRCATTVVSAILQSGLPGSHLPAGRAALGAIREAYTAAPLRAVLAAAHVTVAAVQLGAEAAGIPADRMWTRVIDRAMRAAAERDRRTGS